MSIPRRPEHRADAPQYDKPSATDPLAQLYAQIEDLAAHAAATAIMRSPLRTEHTSLPGALRQTYEVWADVAGIVVLTCDGGLHLSARQSQLWPDWSAISHHEARQLANGLLSAIGYTRTRPRTTGDPDREPRP